MKNQKHLDKSDNYIQGSKTPKGIGNKSYMSQALVREQQKHSLGATLMFRSRTLKEFTFKVAGEVITMMGKNRKDASLNLADLMLSRQPRKVELIRM